MQNIALTSMIAAATLGLSTSVFAQQNDEIALRSQDGTVNLTGAFVSFEDNVYELRTELGLLRISGERVDCFGDACPIVLQQAPVASDKITLRSLDGLVEITGTLLSFENNAYLIETGFGKLEVAADVSVCDGAACPVTNLDDKEVRLAASSEISSGLMMAFVEKFASGNGMEIEKITDENGQDKMVLTDAAGELFAELSIGASNSSNAMQELLSNKVNLAATTRSANETEQTALLGANPDDFARANAETVLALDAIAIAVHPDNPVRAISEDDIARIFSGAVTDWAELGGNPGEIALYGRNTESGTSVVFNDLVLEPAKAELSSETMFKDTDLGVSEAVATDPFAIGYTSFSALGDTKSLAIRGECGIQTPATAFTIKTEEYPLSRRIYMYRPLGSVPQAASDFLDFVKSTDAQTVVAQSGFVGQDVTSVSVNEQGLRFVSSVLPTDADATYEQIQEMLTDLVAADRLSLTFRFDPGSARLDTRSQADVVRLAEMIERGDFESKELLFIGFTDSVGLGEINLNLSAARADQVRSSVLNATANASDYERNITAIGYGEMSPLGCNETFNGRAINRRVEIWTKDIIGSDL